MTPTKNNSDALRRMWKAKNKGELTRIAARCGVTPSFVSDVFYGKRRSLSGQVEIALADANAPGFEPSK